LDLTASTKKQNLIKVYACTCNSAMGRLFYTCSVRILDKPPGELYDWSADVMSEKWDQENALLKLKFIPGALACDALLNQDIFSGVGNIIKNEVLYRVRIHPESLIGKIPQRKLTMMVNEAKNYSFDFLKWKKAYELKKHWLAYNKKICLRCNLPIVKRYTGKYPRGSFFCSNCQNLYE
jgi:endonuclease VIII